MSDTYHIKIKKDYAIAVIEDLQKMDAVELLTDTIKFNLPDWQADLGKKEIELISENPALIMDWEEARMKLKV